MDNRILASLMGVGRSQDMRPTGGRGQKRDATEDEGRLFQQFFDEETKKGAKTTQKESNEISLIEGKKEPEKDSKKLVTTTTSDKAKVDSKMEELQQKLQAEIKEKLTKMNPTLNYLYNLMYKNPDALSLVERQALGLEKQPEYGAGLQEFNKLLSERGIKLSQLTFNQIAKLAQCNTKEQIAAFLDNVVKPAGKKFEDQLKKAGVDEKEKDETVKEMMSDKVAVPKERAENIAETLKAQKTEQNEQAEKTAHQIKREEVIDQIIKQMEIRNFANKTELQMKLNPEYLGELKMNLTYEEGRMVARFETTSREVREMLVESMSDLTDEFTKKGLKVAKTDVKLVDTID